MQLTWSAINELDARFSNSDLMNALGIVFSQYGLLAPEEESFNFHLVVLKSHFSEAKIVGVGDMSYVVEEPFNVILFDQQQIVFKRTMKKNMSATMGKPVDENPLTKFLYARRERDPRREWETAILQNPKDSALQSSARQEWGTCSLLKAIQNKRLVW